MEVANIPRSAWKAEVEKGFVWTVVEHELVGPKAKAKAGRKLKEIEGRAKVERESGSYSWTIYGLLYLYRFW